MGRLIDHARAPDQCSCLTTAAWVTTADWLTPRAGLTGDSQPQTKRSGAKLVFDKALRFYDAINIGQRLQQGFHMNQRDRIGSVR